ncbi:hypothetical protein [Alteromonas sp. S015]|uniref:hypothetical protein n=1 Tax=Alteromonas sp. S015 TaxID=3117401 RepID=UPI002FE4120A
MQTQYKASLPDQTRLSVRGRQELGALARAIEVNPSMSDELLHRVNSRLVSELDDATNQALRETLLGVIAETQMNGNISNNIRAALAQTQALSSLKNDIVHVFEWAEKSVKTFRANQRNTHKHRNKSQATVG